jgi:transcriptional regulator with XRE-family HTH domain
MSAGSLLRRARRKAGLSQRALAQAAEVPQSTVGRIEAGLINPRVATLAKLLDACGYELEALQRLGEGVDRTLIQELLALTPRQRIDYAATASRNVRRLVESARKKR